MISTTKIITNTDYEAKTYERTARVDENDIDWLYITIEEDNTYSKRNPGRSRSHDLLQNDHVRIFTSCENRNDLVDEFKVNHADGEVFFYIRVPSISSYQIQISDTVIRIRRRFIFQRISEELAPAAPAEEPAAPNEEPEPDLSGGVIPVDEEKLKQMIDLGIDETKAREFLFITMDDVDEALSMYYDSLNNTSSFGTSSPVPTSPPWGTSPSPPWGTSPTWDASNTEHSGATQTFSYIASDEDITMVQTIVGSAPISKIKQYLSDTAGNVALTVQLLLEQEDKPSTTFVPVTTFNSFGAFVESSDSDDSVESTEILTERVAKLVVDADASHLKIPSNEYVCISAGFVPNKLISAVYKVPRHSLYPRALLKYDESSHILRFFVRDPGPILRQSTLDILLEGSESIHHRPVVFKLHNKIYIHRGCFERIEHNGNYIDTISMNANGVFLKKENSDLDQEKRLKEAHYKAHKAYQEVGNYGGGEFKNDFDYEGPDHKLEEAALSDDPVINHHRVLNQKFRDIADRVQLARTRKVPKLYIRNFIKLSMEYIQIQLNMSHALLKKAKRPTTLIRASSVGGSTQEPLPVLLRNKSADSYELIQLKKQRATLEKIIRLDPTKERLDKLKKLESEITRLS